MATDKKLCRPRSRALYVLLSYPQLALWARRISRASLADQSGASDPEFRETLNQRPASSIL